MRIQPDFLMFFYLWLRRREKKCRSIIKTNAEQLICVTVLACWLADGSERICGLDGICGKSVMYESVVYQIKSISLCGKSVMYIYRK